MRAILEKAFQIPPEAWDEPAKGGGDLPSTASRLRTVDTPQAPTPESNDDDPIAAEIRSCRALANRILRDIEDDPECTPLERSKVLASAISALERVSKLTGEHQISGTKILRLPIWKQIEKALARALQPYPEAAAAVTREMKKLDEEFSAL